MPVSEIGDPRLHALFGIDAEDSNGVRPSIRLPRKDVSSVVLAISAVLLGLLLFALLNARRTSLAQKQEEARQADIHAAPIEAPPPLYIPPVRLTVDQAPLINERAVSAPFLPMPATKPKATQPQIIYAPQPVPKFLRGPPVPPAAPPRASAGAPLVIDSSNGGGDPNASSAPAASQSPTFEHSIGRKRASAFANRSMTVPQGFLIPAVLETGFDSTSPGFARAMVSRDVRGFDGKNILIPRGSRLIGEYGSVTEQGQRRAVVLWTRLIRPDGLTIALDSPAVDTLGRGGIAASVNTHFFQRLGDALLQSTFEIGRVIAGRATSEPTVVVSGSAAAATTQISSGTNYVPTLTVPAGRSISVFVAHDLDFSAADVGE